MPAFTYTAIDPTGKKVSGSVVYGVIEMAAGAEIRGRLVAAALATPP